MTADPRGDLHGDRPDRTDRRPDAPAHRPDPTALRPLRLDDVHRRLTARYRPTPTAPHHTD